MDSISMRSFFRLSAIQGVVDASPRRLRVEWRDHAASGCGVRQSPGRFAAKLLHLLLALSLIMASLGAVPLGFASPAFSDGDSVDLSDYALPDGSLPVLCWRGEENGESGAGLTEHCPYCRIAGDLEIPQPFDAARISLPSSLQTWHSRSVAQWLAVFTPDTPPRGPPSFFAQRSS